MGPTWFRAAGERFTGLELLFDLVFVFSVSQLTRVVREDPSWRSGLVVLLLFVPVWWSWSGITFATDRFPADDGLSRFLVIGAAAGSATMALAIPAVPGAGEAAFACGYAAVRFALVAYYLRVRRDEPDGGGLARFYAAGFAVVGALWLLSLLLLPAPLRPLLWAAAVVLDVGLPQLAARRRILLPVDGPHLAERCAAFVIIVVGEAVVETLALASEKRLSWGTAATTAAAAALSIAFWWGFFDHGSWRRRYEGLGGEGSGRTAAIVVSYLHLPLVMGIAAGAAGVQIAVLHPDRAIGTAAVAIAVGCVLYLLALNAMTWVLHVARSESLARTRFAIIAGLVVLTAFGRGWPPAVWIALVVGLLSVHGAAAGARSRRDRGAGRRVGPQTG